MSFILGLTGPTGAGKSIFSDCAGDFGFKVIDCDIIARRAVMPGMPALSLLKDAFGEEILFKSGELDRKKLASIAFSDKEKTELLNQTVLPYIKELVLKEITGDLVLLDAPTLFESGIDSICDKTVAVLAPAKVRRARIIERDGIDAAAADARISAGKPDEFYMSRVDFAVRNDGDLKSFTKKVKIYLSDTVGGIKNE